MSKQTFQNMLNITVEIFKQIETYIKERICSQYNDEIIDDLFVKIYLPYNSHLVNIEIFSSSVNAIVVYDMMFVDFLLHCGTKTIYTTLDSKLDEMIEKIYKLNREEELQRIYLDTII